MISRARKRNMRIERLCLVCLGVSLTTLVACSGDSAPVDPLQDLDDDNSSDLCRVEDMFVPGGATRAEIVALVDPLLVEGLDGTVDYLAGTDRVIGVAVDGQFIAVPHNILWRHEIVNIQVAGLPLAVTYSPLSGSSMVFDRRPIGGSPVGVADQVLYNNLVMVNGLTNTLWPQMVRNTNCGGSQLLPMYSAIEMKWEGWLSLHPQTLVVSGETGYNYDYRTYPYGEYEKAHNTLTYYPQETFDDRMGPKERVLGIPYPSGRGLAIPFSVLQSRGGRAAFQWDLEGESHVVFWDIDLRAAIAYKATVNGQVLTFFRVNRFVDGRFFDEETGSEWSFEGVAFAGPLTGTKLTRVVESYVSFWFAWSTFVPETFVMSTRSDEGDGLNAGKNDPPGLNPDRLIAPENSVGELWERPGTPLTPR